MHDVYVSKAIVTQFVTFGHAICSHPRSRAVSNIHRGRDEFKAAKNSLLLFYEKVKQRKLACGIRIVLHNVECIYAYCSC